jgi:hypothetical protein
MVPGEMAQMFAQRQLFLGAVAREFKFRRHRRIDAERRDRPVEHGLDGLEALELTTMAVRLVMDDDLDVARMVNVMAMTMGDSHAR